MTDSLDREMIRAVTQHLDTEAERLYERSLVVSYRGRDSRAIGERRAKLLRIASELRELAGLKSETP